MGKEVGGEEKTSQKLGNYPSSARRAVICFSVGEAISLPLFLKYGRIVSSPTKLRIIRLIIPLGGKGKNKPKIRYGVPNFSLLFSLVAYGFWEEGGFRALRSAGISLRARSDQRIAVGSQKTFRKVLSKL